MRRKILVPTLLVPLAVACAPFQQVSAGSLSPEQTGLVEKTCTNVLGLKRGEAYFADCQDSLAHSLARKSQAQASVAAGDVCRRRGLAANSSAFAICVLDEQQNALLQTSTTPIEAVELAPAAAAALESGKSYYNVSPEVQFQRQRYACAQLGLTPDGGLFGTCVASLTGAFMPDD